MQSYNRCCIDSTWLPQRLHMEGRQHPLLDKFSSHHLVACYARFSKEEDILEGLYCFRLAWLIQYYNQQCYEKNMHLWMFSIYMLRWKININQLPSIVSKIMRIEKPFTTTTSFQSKSSPTHHFFSSTINENEA